MKIADLSKFQQNVIQETVNGADDLDEQLEAVLEALETDDELIADVEAESKSRDRLRATGKSAFRKARRAK